MRSVTSRISRCRIADVGGQGDADRPQHPLDGVEEVGVRDQCTRNGCGEDDRGLEGPEIGVTDPHRAAHRGPADRPPEESPHEPVAREVRDGGEADAQLIGGGFAQSAPIETALDLLEDAPVAEPHGREEQQEGGADGLREAPPLGGVETQQAGQVEADDGDREKAPV